MQLLKLAGCLTVVLSSSAIGYLYSKRFSDRPQHLRMIQVQLQLLETEIGYMRNTIAEALKRISAISSGPTAEIFKYAGIYIENKDFMTAYEAWAASVKSYIYKTALDSEDEELLISFGKLLGCTDCEGQTRNIRNMISQLKIQEQKAESERIKNEKMYRNFGVLCGIAIVILLI